MHTIAPPAVPWGAPLGTRGRYAPTRPNGKRVPGWEDTNVTLLASDLGISFRYLLAVLSGQRNCTLALLQQAAQALALPLPDLITRMERAYHLRQIAVANPPDRVEQRRQRSERRALSMASNQDEG